MALGRLFTSCFRSEADAKGSSTTAPHIDNEDFYRFQSGRWLWDGQKQLDKRSRRFNAAALQDIAASSLGAKHCVSMIKISEDGRGNNRVFRLVMNNRKVAIAKIPYWRAASGRLRVSSEVATMDFASRMLGLPVPKVLAWDASDTGPVQTEYILMEEARGAVLSDSWDTLQPDNKAEILDQLALMAGKFQSVSFSHIGNIFFAADNIPGAVPAVVGGNLTDKMKAQVRQRYTIGPTVMRHYWDEERAKMTNVHGPWRDAQDWLKAIAAREIAWLDRYATEREQVPMMPAPKGTKETHIELWKKFAASTEFLTYINKGLLRSTLWHRDIVPSNIFVKKNKISALIDWEGSCATPLLFAADRPTMLMPGLDVMPVLPRMDQLAQMMNGPDATQAAKTMEWHYMRYAYEHTLSTTSPAFAQIERVPLILTLQQLVRQAVETWTTGVFATRSCLITLQDQWNDLCPGKPCPFEITADERAEHAAEEPALMEIGMLVVASHSLMDIDGFVETRYAYEQMANLFAHLHQFKLQQPQDAARDEVVGALAWAVKK